jgi:hypothetical protein
MPSGPAYVSISFTLPNDSARYPAGATNAAGEKIGGRYTGTGNRLRPLYQRLADELQNNVADTILAKRQVRDKNPMKKNPKGTLAKVTRQPGNQNVTNEGFSVGSHTHLGRSVAKYYRIIEEGSVDAAPKYSSSMISVAKGKNGFEIWKPRGAGFGTQYPIPEKDETRVKNRNRRNIEPLYAYTEAWRDINASGRLLQIWREILVDLGVVSARGGPLPKRFELGNINY